MRKLMWVLVGVMMMVTLFSTFVNAAEWGSDQSIIKFTDETFQLKMTVSICKAINPNDMTRAKECAKNNYAAYIDITSTIKDMGSSVAENPSLENTKIYEAMVNCLMSEIEQHWHSSFNTAPWMVVRDNALQCMQEAKARLE